ncbi:hypothetical protein F5B22DRAFT_603552 [Xylaria bambusicola]|uniref:uncharacterized protein n=1 Tax=Xylaria bambusicola TaxID=326684 RepID=UPI0020079DE7|nr:uncharacterized protein F5B22DRAFT_603552 [Xylaria bambusicola]KAI0517619.1 hypothetical protein F5B22DRAFT_603552 [Xylaria bambusicola]
MADIKLNKQEEEEEQKKQSTMEWAREKYNEQYDAWMPWIEDTFLKYFTKDNRASYVTRDGLDRTKVTGIDQVDSLQDGTHNLAASTLGQGGILEPVGDAVSAGMKKADPRPKKSEKNGGSNNIPVVSNLGSGLGL